MMTPIRTNKCWGCRGENTYGWALTFCSEKCYYSKTKQYPNKAIMGLIFTLVRLKIENNGE